jgi:hypothetical protein
MSRLHQHPESHLVALTDTYSPAAIDMAPATSPATPAIRTSPGLAAAAATPTIRLAVETIPSLVPRTAALSHPMRATGRGGQLGATLGFLQRPTELRGRLDAVPLPPLIPRDAHDHGVGHVGTHHGTHPARSAGEFYRSQAA